MSVSISVGKIDKRVNSTKIQGYDPSINADATLRDPCDIKNPVFILEGAAGNYNYAKWSSRYYWVDKVIPMPNGIIEVHCYLDPLATYQSAIFNTTAYMAFNSLLRNTEIDDPRMNPEIMDETKIDISDIFDSAPVINPSNGSVIITTFECGQGAANQGVKTYALTVSGFMAMLDYFQTSFYDNAYNTNNVSVAINAAMANFSDPDNNVNMMGAAQSVFTHDILKALTDIGNKIQGVGSWRDNLLKALYVPFNVSDFTSLGSKTIYCGMSPGGGSGKLINPAEVKTKTTSAVIPWSGKCTDYHFLKYNKYSKMQAICNGGQYCDINTDLIRNKTSTDSLYCHSSVDICSGEWGAVITDDSSKNSTRLAGFGGCMGIDILGLAGKGGLGAGMNWVAGGFKMAAEVLSMGMSDSLFGKSTGIASQFIQNSVNGHGSGVAGNNLASMFLNGSTGYNDISIVCKTFYPSILDATGTGTYDSYGQKYGFPCNQYGKLGDYTGAFIKCEGASVSAEASDSELAFINAACNSGIYIES